MSAGRTRVWDPFVRIAHWSLALIVVLELVNEAGANPWHRYLGYTAACVVLLRLLWGLTDSGYARLATMAATARNAAGYLKALPRAQSSGGHNPLGALMAFTLWGLTLLAVLTGWMLGLDRFWGEQWLQDLHAVLAYALAGCAVLHIIGAVATSRAQHQNLIKAMITGTKSAP